MSSFGIAIDPTATELRALLNTADTTNHALRSDIDILTAKYTRLRSKYTKLKTDHKKLQAQHQDITNKCGQLERAIAKLDHKRKSLKQKYRQSKHTIDHLHERILVDVDGVFKYNSVLTKVCLLYTSPSPRDGLLSRMPSSA